MTSNHHLPSGILFFKIILDATLQQGKLKIPNKFTMKHGCNLANPVFLKAPDGIEWEVYWRKHDDGAIWLQKGWNEFATYYSLRHGHLVLFKYKKTCRFEVRILDESALEIEYSFNGDGVHQSSEKRPVEYSHEVIPSPKPRKKLKKSSSGVVGQSSNLHHDVQIKVEQSQEVRAGATESGKVEQVSSSVTGTSRSKAPSFSVVLKASYLSGYSAVIPSKFVKEYLKEERRDFQLRVLGGGTYTVNFTKGRFCTGWNKFVSGNHLNVGDVCVFELTKSRGHCFKVTIVPISEESRSRPVQGNGDPVRIPDTKCVTDIPIKAMQEAGAFTSANPFFQINIRANNKEDFRPRVPVSFVNKYLKNKQVVTLHFENKLCPVKFVGEFPTKLSKGWNIFANESKVKAGDICVFELINEVDAVFLVHIYRQHFRQSIMSS